MGPSDRPMPAAKPSNDPIDRSCTAGQERPVVNDWFLEGNAALPSWHPTCMGYVSAQTLPFESDRS